MIETFMQELPHGITLSCRAAGERGRPALVFLHGFPEAAFIWDEMLEHFSQPAHGGYRCVAPNLRGYERSTAPSDVDSYRAKSLVRDVAALIDAVGAPVECLVAHDWGGAVAWLVANAHPRRLRRLAIVNSPHPGTFLRELRDNPAQQDASAYMNFLVRPDAEQRLRENDYQRIFGFFTGLGEQPWLTPEVKDRYREVWNRGLNGALNYYRASPLRPPRPGDPGASAVTLPREMLTVDVPTLVVWGMRDLALPPPLLDGLEDYVRDLTIQRIAEGSHWIVHDHAEVIQQHLSAFLLRNS